MNTIVALWDSSYMFGLGYCSLKDEGEPSFTIYFKPSCMVTSGLKELDCGHKFVV
jgi:hypothetical protein